MNLILSLLSLFAGIYIVWGACKPPSTPGSTFVYAVCGSRNGTYCSTNITTDGVNHKCHCWGKCVYICDPDPNYERCPKPPTTNATTTTSTTKAPPTNSTTPAPCNPICTCNCPSPATNPPNCVCTCKC